MFVSVEEHGDDLEAAIRAQLAANGGRQPDLAAQDRGLTMMAAAQRFRKPMAVVRQIYRSAVGRCDPWNVWWAPPDELLQVFAEPGAVAVAIKRVSVQRTIGRRDRLRAKISGQRA